MIDKINFTGNLTITKRANKKSRENEINTIKDYADKNNADVFIFEKTATDKKITYEALVTKNGKIWYKSFVPKEMNQTITRTISGDRITQDPVTKTKDESDNYYNPQTIVFKDSKAYTKDDLNPLTGKTVFEIGDYSYRLTYNKGLIVRSEKFDNEDFLIKEKIYSYDGNSNLEHIISQGESTTYIKYDNYGNKITVRDENFIPKTHISKQDSLVRIDNF